MAPTSLVVTASPGAVDVATRFDVEQVHRAAGLQADQLAARAGTEIDGDVDLAFGGADPWKSPDLFDLIGVEWCGGDDDVGQALIGNGCVQRALRDGRDRQHADRSDGERQREDAGDDPAGCPPELCQEAVHHATPRYVSEAIRPSTMATTRSAAAASERSWVMKTTVVPSPASLVSTSNTACPLAWSSAPVGSSATISGGCVTIARAIPTRCCSPPLSWAGNLRRVAGEADPLEGGDGGAFAESPSGAARSELDRQLDVLLGGERGEQMEVLEDDPDVAAAPRRQSVDLESVDAGVVDDQRARARLVDPGDQGAERALAGSGGTDDRDQLTAADLEIDVGDADLGGAALAPHSGQVARVDDRMSDRTGSDDRRAVGLRIDDGGGVHVPIVRFSPRRRHGAVWRIGGGDIPRSGRVSGGGASA